MLLLPSVRNVVGRAKRSDAKQEPNYYGAVHLVNGVVPFFVKSPAPPLLVVNDPNGFF